MTVPAIPFQLDQPQNSGTLTYRPFGVRTIRLKISSPSENQPPLRLRAGRMMETDKANGTFRGFPKDSEALMVSWGGGHEPGPCVKPKDFLKFKEEPDELPYDETGYIYFNLTHIKPDELPETADLTIEAYNPKDETVVSRLTITLKKPAHVPAKFGQIVSDTNAIDTWKFGGGDFLPAYDPRWFPEAVDYKSETDDLPLRIRRLDNSLKVYWGDTAEPIIILTDNTKPSLLTPGDHRAQYRNTVLFELFNFDDNHVALRIWFYWLNRNIGRQRFIGGHEVPDSERFDFIMRKNSGRPIFVCTDLHWSEVWGEVPEEIDILNVSLGISRGAVLDKVKKNISQGREILKAGADRKKKRVVRALQAVGGWLGWDVEADDVDGRSEHAPDSEAASAHNPIVFIRERADTLYKKAYANEVRDKGSEAHLPWMHGVIEYHRSPATKRNLMVSNDVRLVLDG